MKVVLHELDKSLNDLRDKRLITANTDKISRIELTKKGQDIAFGRDKDEWQIRNAHTALDSQPAHLASYVLRLGTSFIES